MDKPSEPETTPPGTPAAGSETAPDAAVAPSKWGRLIAWGAGGLAGLVVLYYVIGAVYLYHMDDDPEFFASVEIPEGGSASVAVAAALVDREVNTYSWLANDPFFMPSVLLDNTPNFQRGVVAAVSRFAVELTDVIARVRGSSQIDRNAEEAAGQLKYPGDVWFLEWSSTPVQPSSESQYRRALENLRTYNERLSEGSAVFEKRSDNLLTALDRIASDLGSSSAALFQHIDTRAGAFYDLNADDLFYENKGRLYAFFLIMKGLEADFSSIINGRELAGPWQNLMESLERAAVIDPLVVGNGALDGQLVPNHLAAQGFLLLRARVQLREITNILQT